MFDFFEQWSKKFPTKKIAISSFVSPIFDFCPQMNQDRSDSLILELQELTEKYKTLESKNRSLNTKIFEQQSKLIDTEENLHSTKIKLKEAEQKIKTLTNQLKDKERQFRAKIKRKENTVRKYEGSNKIQTQYLMQNEIDETKKQNDVYKKFIIKLSEKLGFDFELFEHLSDVMDGNDDPIINLFLQNIKEDRMLEIEVNKRSTNNLDDIWE